MHYYKTFIFSTIFLALSGSDWLFAQSPSSAPAQRDSLTRKALIGVDSLSLTYFQRRQEWVKTALAAFDSMRFSDTLQFKISNRFTLDAAIPDSIRFRDDMHRTDPPGEQLKREQTGIGAGLDFGGAVRAADALINRNRQMDLPRVQDLPLPSPIEMDVLNVLWRDGPSTSPELFAQMDSSALAQMTAEMFWEVLHNMAKRGFVSEEIVSPQLLMGFAIGPMVVPVEMSTKNLKNRVWEYQPLVQADDMFSYVLARNYLARGENARFRGADNLTKSLLAKMLEQRREPDQPSIQRP